MSFRSSVSRMSYSRILRGFRMFRRMRLSYFILLTLLYFPNVTGTLWYCKDAECSDPVSEGISGYDYNPSEAAVQNGYLPVSAGKVMSVLKLSNQPDVLQVEVDGKRGFVPRPLYDVKTSFMPDKVKYIVVEGPNIPSEEEILAREEQKALLDKGQEEKPILTATPVPAEPAVPLASAVLPLDVPASGTEKASAVPVTETVKAQEIPPRPVEEVPVPKQDVSPETPTAIVEEVPPAVPQPAATVPAPPSAAAVESVAVPPAPPVLQLDDITVSSFHSTEDVTHGLSDDSQPDSANEVGDVATEHVAAQNESKPSENNVNVESVTKTPDIPPAPLSDVKTEPTQPVPDSVVQVKQEVEVKAAEAVVPPVEVQPAMELNSATPPTAVPTSTPALTTAAASDLNEMAKKLVDPPPAASGPLSDVPPSVSDSDSAPKIVSTPVEKRPEPTVVFQQADFRASLPGLYRSNDQPVVFNTKSLLRHHHGHDHHHGHHHHDHSHDHSHEHHEHSHDSHDSHADSHADHDHDHSDHSHPTLTPAPEPEERSNQVQPVSEPSEVPVTPEEAVSTDLTVEVFDETIGLVPRKYVPPEDVTKPPVNYTQLVQDRIDGKGGSQILIDNPDREPSEGFPNPPALQDPSTATDAPQIPGMSDALAASEMQRAIDANPRYSRRRLGHPGEGHPQLGEAPHNRLEEHGHHHHDHESSEVMNDATGHCRAGVGGGEGSCEEFDTTPDDDEARDTVVRAKNDTESQWSALVDRTKTTVRYGWKGVEKVVEKLPGLFFLGVVVFAIASMVFGMSALRDRQLRRDQHRGFEEYDHNKEKELLTLREQIQVLLKQNQDLVAGRPLPTVAPPPTVSVVPPQRSGPCHECESMRVNMHELNQVILDREQDLKDHRETHATLLSKNNDVDTQLRLMQKERDELKRQLEDFRFKFADAERRLNSVAASKSDRRPSHGENDKALLGRLQLLEEENASLRFKIQTSGQSQNSNGLDSSEKMALQSERDEAASNVRLLRQLLAEKEEEIRRNRSAEAAGGLSSSRELQEKSEDLRSAKKQIVRLQQDLSSVKRDFETQLQIRGQTFRAAADKAQRDAVMARQEILTVRQQLEDVCRRTGEPVPPPPTPVQSLANGAMTPPGLMPSPPLMFAGLGFPSGPPPPTLEAFKQHVLMQQGHSSGHSSPPDLDRERRREKRMVKKSHTADFPANGKDDLDDDRKRDRTYR